MPSDNLREWIIEQVEPLLPDTWRIVPNQKTPETITTTTVVLKFLSLEPLPEAPRGALRAGCVLTVITPYTDEVKAENDLDDAVLTAITALDGHKYISWTEGRKIRDEVAQRLGWDLTFSTITTRPIADTATDNQEV